MRTKRCRRCNETKSGSEFYQSSNTKDGLHSYCKRCHAQYMKQYHSSPRGKAITQKLRDSGYFTSGKGAFLALRQGAEKRGLQLALTYEDWQAWTRTTPDECVYCGSSLAKFLELRDFIVEYEGDTYAIAKFRRFFRSSKHAKISRMTIDRVDNAFGYTLDNIVKCCWICNSLKNDFLSEKHMKLIAPDIIDELASAIQGERQGGSQVVASWHNKQ